MHIQAFLKRCDAAAACHGISRGRLSTILFGSGATIDRLQSGAGVTVRVLDRAIVRLNAWSEGRATPDRGEAA
jgi:hypothetical protein